MQSSISTVSAWSTQLTYSRDIIESQRVAQSSNVAVALGLPGDLE
jgi:hypothetical protein